MLEKLLHRLKAMDTGIKIALGLFLGSAVVLGLTGGDEEPPGRPAEAPAEPLKARKTPKKRAAAPPAEKERSPEQAALDRLPRSVRIEATGLHWLAITTMDYPLGGPMDVEAVGGELFVLTRHGELTWYDPAAETFAAVGTVELNRAALEASDIYRSKGFKRSYFRAFGLLVEPAGDGFRAYVAHHLFADGCFWFRISTLGFRVGEGGAEVVQDWQPLYTADPCVPPLVEAGNRFGGHQAGGRMIPHGPDHFLVTIGDHELDGRKVQPAPLDPASAYGKIMLVDKRTGAARVFASGVRNPQGLVRLADGRIFATEHGPRGGDELNLIEEGASYGWPEVTYGILYGLKPWPLAEEQGRHDGHTRPVHVWLPSVAVSNLVEPVPGQFEHWQGDLIVGSLKRQSLYRLRFEDGHVIYDEPIPIGHRIRDIEVLPSGAFVIVTDDRKLLLLTDAGRVYEPNLSKREVAAALPFVVRPSAEDLVAADVAPLSGAELFEERCASCHTLDGEIEVSVPLNGLFQRQIGSYPGYPYSDVLAKDQRQWDRHQLRVFLLKPDEKFDGTAMPDPNLTREQAFTLANYLAEFKPEK